MSKDTEPVEEEVFSLDTFIREYEESRRFIQLEYKEEENDTQSVTVVLRNVGDHEVLSSIVHLFHAMIKHGHEKDNLLDTIKKTYEDNFEEKE